MFYETSVEKQPENLTVLTKSQILETKIVNIIPMV